MNKINSIPLKKVEGKTQIDHFSVNNFPNFDECMNFTQNMKTNSKQSSTNYSPNNNYNKLNSNK